MDTLIIVRHGDYDDFGKKNLSYEGKKFIRRLAEEIIHFTKDKKVIILSSNAKRASESAEIIKTKLGVEKFENKEILLSGSGHPTNFPGVFELIDSYEEKTDVLILVTHLEYTNWLAYYFAQKKLNFINLPEKLTTASAHVVDCNNKTITRIGSIWVLFSFIDWNRAG